MILHVETKLSKNGKKLLTIFFISGTVVSLQNNNDKTDCSYLSIIGKNIQRSWLRQGHAPKLSFRPYVDEKKVMPDLLLMFWLWSSYRVDAEGVGVGASPL
jgi:hypothetical protein